MRNRIFKALSNLASNRPWWTLLGGLVLLVGAASVSGGIRLDTRVLDLVPDDDPAALEFNDILRQYSSASQLIVGIEGDNPAEMIGFAEALGKRANEAVYTERGTGKKKPYVKRIVVKADADFIAEHGLMLSKVSDLENIEELYRDLEMVPLLTAYNDFLEREYIEDSGSVTEREKEDRAIDGLKNMLVWLGGIGEVSKGEGALDNRARQVSDLLSQGNPYLFSDDDTLLLAMVTPAISIDQMEETLGGVKSLRDDVIKEIQKEFPNLKVRLAGMPALGLEEGEVVAEDMGVSSVLSLVLVFALFILAFRMWTAPLLAMINLVTGIVWTTGFIALTFGRLNLFTLMFAVILLGLGIDFAIHLNAAFSTARSEGKDIEGSILEMFNRAGAGVVTGAFTTAMAFMVLALSGLEAFVELGVVLGAGILLTLLASLTVLPAMYTIHARVSDRLSKDKRPKPVRLSFPFLFAMGRGISARPVVALVLFLLLTAAFGYAARGAGFEPDMLEIEPPDMPSVLLHREIIKQFELHPDYAMVTSKSLEETRPIVKKLKKNRLVGRVDAITEFLPTEKEQTRRARIVSRIGARMEEIEKAYEANRRDGAAKVRGGTDAEAKPEEPDGSKEKAPPDTAQLLSELDRLQMNVQEIGQLAFASVKIRLQNTCDRLTGGEDGRFSQILALKKELQDDSKTADKIMAYEKAYVPLLAKKLKRMANPSKITFQSLPDVIRDRYMSREGDNLVTIYASVDLWQEGKTELFLKATSSASKRVTGTAVLMDRLITLIGSRGLVATFLALGAVFLLLLIDFRSLRFALLGMMPLLCGFTWMVGSFVLLGKKFDVANVMAIPLILGIGIDDAVHVLHAIKRHGSFAIPTILKHTGRALLLTSLTTGIAFGTIALSSHRGMAGMGQLLVLGVTACFVASVVVLPALSRIFLKDGKSKQQAKEASHV